MSALTASPTLVDHLFARIVAGPNCCWVWTGGLNKDGYGSMKRGGKYVGAHRFSYEVGYGKPIPSGLSVHHTCHNRRCVNPKHLEVVTHAENMARSLPALRTHCKRGHPLSGPNLYVNPASNARVCRECRRERDARLRGEL